MQAVSKTVELIGLRNPRVFLTWGGRDSFDAIEFLEEFLTFCTHVYFMTHTTDSKSLKIFFAACFKYNCYYP
jgi:hypothetical protein